MMAYYVMSFDVFIFIISSPAKNKKKKKFSPPHTPQREIKSQNHFHSYLFALSLIQQVVLAHPIVVTSNVPNILPGMYMVLCVCMFLYVYVSAAIKLKVTPRRVIVLRTGRAQEIMLNPSGSINHSFRLVS